MRNSGVTVIFARYTMGTVNVYAAVRTGEIDLGPYLVVHTLINLNSMAEVETKNGKKAVRPRRISRMLVVLDLQIINIS